MFFHGAVSVFIRLTLAFIKIGKVRKLPTGMDNFCLFLTVPLKSLRPMQDATRLVSQYPFCPFQRPFYPFRAASSCQIKK